MRELESILQKVKTSVSVLAKMTSAEKNHVLNKIADRLLTCQDEILVANAKDVMNAKEHLMKESLIDRLRLDKKRIESMAEGVRKVVALPDPVGEILEGKVLANGLEIMKKRVPLGVVAIIYESRPNVTVDAFSLCFKAGNATVLKGGSDAIHTNTSLVEVIKEVLIEENILEDVLYLVEDTSRQVTHTLMKMNSYIDVLIPRGGRGLIQNVVENSTIPVIETGTGNCHIYVDESANFEMALAIIENAKTQRTGVCNACESLVVHEKISEVFVPMLVECLGQKNVEIRGDDNSCHLHSDIIPATVEDWDTEYLDLILSLKIVSNIEEAISHINKHSTGHSESIITDDYTNAKRFLNEIDSSAVYVNSSTRFTDGEEFGLGAEIGISTQKLHARGPMGLRALTTTKYLIYGNGQIRK